MMKVVGNNIILEKGDELYIIKKESKSQLFISYDDFDLR